MFTVFIPSAVDRIEVTRTPDRIHRQYYSRHMDRVFQICNRVTSRDPWRDFDKLMHRYGTSPAAEYQNL